MLGSLRIASSHFSSLPHESPSTLASLPDMHASDVARAPSAAGLMPDAAHRSRKRRADAPSEAPSMMPPLVAHAPAASTTHTFPSTTRRKSTRIRSSSAYADSSSVDTGSRKRKTSPDPKTPPAKKRAPGRLKADPDDEKDVQHESTCCICMTEPDPADLASINICEHMFCFDCIEKWADRENTCPLCKKRFVKIDRVNKTKKKSAVSSKKVKNRSQRSEITQTFALESLFGELGPGGLAMNIESIFCKCRSRMKDGNVVIVLTLSFLFLSVTARLSARGGFNTQFARIVVNGMSGSGVFETRPFEAARVSVPLNAAPEAARMPHQFEDVFFGSDDEDDGYNGFVASIRNMDSVGGSTLFGGYRPRSFASNMHDADAGDTADNALEIEDSDDEVEVVHVSPGM